MLVCLVFQYLLQILLPPEPYTLCCTIGTDNWQPKKQRTCSWLLICFTEKANAVVKSINDAAPNRAIAVAGDVQDHAYLKRVVEKAAEFGNGKIHIIVNNAGFTWDGVIHKVCLVPSFPGPAGLDMYLCSRKMMLTEVYSSRTSNGTP